MDEAYSLVKDRRDTFGLEAVDTLIKEMEDHRGKVIVTRRGVQCSLRFRRGNWFITYVECIAVFVDFQRYAGDLHPLGIGVSG